MKSLRKVLEENGVNPYELAVKVLPGHKYAVHAFERILDGKSILSVDHLTAISSHTGIPIQTLLGITWKSESSEPKEVIFTSSTGLKILVWYDSWTFAAYTSEGEKIAAGDVNPSLSVEEFLQSIFENLNLNTV